MPAEFQALAGLAGTNESWVLLTPMIIAPETQNRVAFKCTSSGIKLRLAREAANLGPGLRTNFDGRAYFNLGINLVDFLVGYGYAAVCPVRKAVLGPNPSPLRTQPVNFHIAAGIHTQFP